RTTRARGGQDNGRGAVVPRLVQSVGKCVRQLRIRPEALGNHSGTGAPRDVDADMKAAGQQQWDDDAVVVDGLVDRWPPMVEVADPDLKAHPQRAHVFS